jgi:molybdopterin converting factor small subunit
MTQVNLPTVYRAHADGNRHVDLKADDVGSLLVLLTQQHPDLQSQILDDDGELLSFVNIFVNDQNIRDLEGKATKLTDRDEVFLVPAMAGG